MAYSSALLLDSTNSNNVLTKWISLMLSFNGNIDKTLRAATKFKVLTLLIYCVICDTLQQND
ncbi:hypothetical protein HD554DRAFT_2172467 [Boletus coccyginus]|nr:hypothetical protein HD554DRAFT_2172467 [Boletus coccyginus]